MQGLLRITPDRPADTALHQIHESRLAPGALVVTPGCVKNSTFSVRAGPGVRLETLVISPDFEHDAVFFIVLGVDIGLVPACKAIEPFHDRVVGLNDAGAEDASPVPLELAAHQGHDPVIVPEAIGGTVNRMNPFPLST